MDNMTRGVESGLQKDINLPYGISDATKALLLYAIAHKEVFEQVDTRDQTTDKTNKAKKATRNLIAVYFGTEASLTETTKAVGGDRSSAKKRILQGLGIIWEQLPEELQLRYARNDAVRLKDLNVSPQKRLKNSNATTTLWENADYRAKTHAAIKKRGQDQNFIDKMKTISKDRSSPMSGRRHSIQSIDNIRRGVSESWKKRRQAIKLAMKISKESLNVSMEIGEEERSMWEHVLVNNLQEEIIAQGKVTQEDLGLIREYFEKGLIGDRLNSRTFDRFSLAFTTVFHAKLE